eukprot:scaffold19315_cov75-Skeletonema_marinoi.AAC.2
MLCGPAMVGDGVSGTASVGAGVLGGRVAAGVGGGVLGGRVAAASVEVCIIEWPNEGSCQTSAAMHQPASERSKLLSAGSKNLVRGKYTRLREPHKFSREFKFEMCS